MGVKKTGTMHNVADPQTPAVTRKQGFVFILLFSVFQEGTGFRVVSVPAVAIKCSRGTTEVNTRVLLFLRN